MIFIKWLTPWEHSYQAPSIINLFMNMVLGLGSTKGTPLWSNEEQQELIQQIFLSNKIYFLKLLKKKSFGFCVYSLDAFGKTNLFKQEVKRVGSQKEI